MTSRPEGGSRRLADSVEDDGNGNSILGWEQGRPIVTRQIIRRVIETLGISKYHDSRIALIPDRARSSNRTLESMNSSRMNPPYPRRADAGSLTDRSRRRDPGDLDMTFDTPGAVTGTSLSHKNGSRGSPRVTARPSVPLEGLVT